MNDRLLRIEQLEDRWLLSGEPRLVTDINQIFSPIIDAPTDLVDVGGTLFFVVPFYPSNEGLWKSDGTAAGTGRVRPGLSVSGNLTNVGGVLYFTADDGTTGSELWKSDGTAAGTVLVKDIRLGSSASSPSNLTSVGGTLYFTANDGTSGVELWKSDGTSGCTSLVKDILSG